MTRHPRSCNRFVRMYTRAEARAILCRIALELGTSPSASDVPHSQAVIGAMGFQAMGDAVASLGLIPNRPGPSAKHAIPAGWTGAQLVREPVPCGVDLDGERRASLARQKERREELARSHMPRRLPAETLDDYAEPVDLTEEPEAWWAA